jgi:hypothetical protein
MPRLQSRQTGAPVEGQRGRSAGWDLPHLSFYIGCLLLFLQRRKKVLRCSDESALTEGKFDEYLPDV